MLTYGPAASQTISQGFFTFLFGEGWKGDERGMAFCVRIGTISDRLRGWTRKLLFKLVATAKLLIFLDARGTVLSNVDILKGCKVEAGMQMAAFEESQDQRDA